MPEAAVQAPGYRPFHAGAWWALLALVAAGPLSTKIAGAGWLLYVLLGAWAAWRWPVVAPRTDAGRTLEQAALVALLLCAVAFALRTVPQLYWGDPWEERHFDFRVLLAAMATYGLVRRVRLSQRQLLELAAALALAALVAFVVVNLKGRDTPSNAITWGAGIAFMACALLPLLPRVATRPLWLLALGAGVVLAGATILLTGSRGIYPALLWVAGLALVLALSNPKGRRRVLPGLVVATVAVVIVAALQPQVWQFPLQRTTEARNEAVALLAGGSRPSVEAIDTSVGIRLHMWQRSLEAIPQSPWLGNGREGRLELIRQWGREADSKLLGSMFHVHNDWLHVLMDHGAVGAGSVLLFLLAPVAAAWVLRRQMPLPATALAGIAVAHGVAGLTIVTTAHNHYGVMFSLMAGLVLVSALAHEDRGSGSTSPRSSTV